MRFKTVEDVLEVVTRFHQALAERFAELEQLTTSERAQLMLDYLCRHEQNLARATDQFEQDASAGLLHTWLQYSSDLQPDALLERVRSVDLNDVSGIVPIALEVDDYLLNLYRQVADHTDSPAVREVFLSLAQVEDVERHKLSRAAFRLSDI